MTLSRLKELGIEPLMYSRLKDDNLIALESLEKGTKYVEESLVMDENKKIKMRIKVK